MHIPMNLKVHLYNCIKCAVQPARIKNFGLNDSHAEVISTNLILRAKYERELKIVPVATVTCIAGYGFLVDDNEEKTKTEKERLKGKSIA